MSGRLVVLICTICLLGLAACKSEYERKVEKELSSGVIVDTLFLGFHFGMTKKEFFAHGWEINRKQIAKEGPRNETIMYDLPDFRHNANMYFYPRFHNDTLYRMPVKFRYDIYTPWNKELSNDSLLSEVLNLFKDWYGDDFMKVEHPERGPAYIRVDGNRRISIFKETENTVGALFSDLIVEKEIEGSSD